MSKKQLYTRVELDWLEEKVKQIREHIDNTPLSAIGDRVEEVTDSKGRPVIKVIAKKEDAQKAWLIFLKEFALLVSTLESLREIKANSMETRKGYELHGGMKKFVEERNA